MNCFFVTPILCLTNSPREGKLNRNGEHLFVSTRFHTFLRHLKWLPIKSDVHNILATRVNIIGSSQKDYQMKGLCVGYTEIRFFFSNSPEKVTAKKEN